jgi:hypothetical protein
MINLDEFIQIQYFREVEHYEYLFTLWYIFLPKENFVRVL